MRYPHFITPFMWPVVKLLPMDLEGKITDYEFLESICHKMKDVITNVNALGNEVNVNRSAIAKLQQDVNELEQVLNDIKNGKYTNMYVEFINNYLGTHIKEYVADIVKFVFFGLTQDGHFCAYIPSNWDFLKFDTIMDTKSSLYGHLTIRY